MKIRDPQERLKSAWGIIDRQHNQLIAKHLVGSRVLDVGCGYGSLVAHLSSQGFQAQGIDLDESAVQIGLTLFPGSDLRVANAESLSGYPAAAFDSITLKDSLHHLICEGDFAQAAIEFRRILVPGGRVVILDPNPTWILKLARLLAAHHDVEAAPQMARAALNSNGFLSRGLDYFEICGLPLSGGYVGWRLVPNFGLCNRAVAGINRLASRAVTAIGLGGRLCWRYVLWADAAK